MLLGPRRLPASLNRPVNPQTRRFAARKWAVRRHPRRERWKRLFQRLRHRWSTIHLPLLQWGIAAGGGLLLLGIGLVLFSPLLQLRTITVTRQDHRVDIVQVQHALAPLLHRHLFFLTVQEVRSRILEAVPEVARVDASKQYPSTLRVSVTVEPLIARLEIVDPSGKATGSGEGLPRDYLTSGGIYVAYPAGVVAQDASLPSLRLVDWGVRPVSGTRLLAEDFLTSIRGAEEQLLMQFGQAVLQRTVFLRAREFHLTTKDLTLWFDLRSPIESHIARYRLFLQAAKEKAKEYVDLRLSDRIVYR